MDDPQILDAQVRALSSDDSISVDAVDAFVQHIHRDSTQFPEAHYHDLRRLAKAFRMTEVINALDRFLNDPNHPTRRRDLFIPEVLSAIRHSELTDALETQLSAQLLDYLDDVRTAEIAIPVLLRATERRFGSDPASVSPELFNFFIRCLDTQGEAASILFQTVKLAVLNPGQIQALLDHPKFAWQFVNDNIGVRVFDYIARVDQIEDTVSRLWNMFGAATAWEGVSISNGRASKTIVPLQPLSGIIAGLTDKYRGNVHDRGVVQVSASSCIDLPNFQPKFLVDLKGTHRYTSKAENQRPSVVYDFKDYLVIPTHYEIRSAANMSPRAGHPKSWILEASADGALWKKLDEKSNCDKLDATDVIVAFPLPVEPTPYRFFRLTMTQPVGPDNWAFTFSGWEFYGTLLGSESQFRDVPGLPRPN
jgi:hypothetical protein